MSDELKNFTRKIPTGDNLERLVCRECDWVHYENPRVIVGAVCTWEEKILLCKRAIEPRIGYWTIPAGFMELNETAEAGAAREAMEEANADIAIDALIGIYSIPRISQVQLIYRAKLNSPNVSAGPESADVKFVTWDEIDWDHLAFPSVHWALRHFKESETREVFPPYSAPEVQDSI